MRAARRNVRANSQPTYPPPTTRTGIDTSGIPVTILDMPSPMPTPVAPDVVQATAEARLFRVLGDPTRLRILELLLAGPRTVSELVEAVGAAQSRVSNHLACLRWCALVDTERRGRQVMYRITDPNLGELLGAARRFVDGKVEHLASCQRIGPDWI